MRKMNSEENERFSNKFAKSEIVKKLGAEVSEREWHFNFQARQAHIVGNKVCVLIESK